MDASERSPYGVWALRVDAGELEKCVRSAASSQRNGRPRLEPEGLEVGPKGVAQVGPRERKLDGRLEEAELVARVEALALERDRVHRTAGAQPPEGVGELDLAARVRRRVDEDAEDVRRQHVASDDREVGRRLVRPRLLDEVEDLVHVGGDLARGDHAVLRQALPRDALDGEHRPGVALEHGEELVHARLPRRDDVVAQEHGERLVAHERARTEDGVAQPERLFLPHVGHRRQLRDRPDLGELLDFAPVVQVVLELEGGVKVVLDRALAPTGHDDDLREARRDRLLDDVLDHGLVDEREHLLRLRLRRREESRSEPGGGEPALFTPTGPTYPGRARGQTRRGPPGKGGGRRRHPRRGGRRRDAPRWIVDAEGGAQPLAEGVTRGHRPVRPRPTLSSTATSARMHPAWTRTSATSWGAASLSRIAERPSVEAMKKMSNTLCVFVRPSAAKRWCMWSFPVYASHSWSECTLPVTTRTMPTNAMSNSGTPRISIGVNSDTTGSRAAHTPIAARPARVKPMKLAPLSPRKIVAPPGRKLYGRNPRHAPTSAADRNMRYRWPV